MRRTQMVSAFTRLTAHQAFQVLIDWRVWIVALTFLAICLSIDLIWGSRASSIAALPLGLVGSYMLSLLDIEPGGQNLRVVQLIRKNVLYALAAILIVYGAEAIPRLVVLPWHWLYGEQIETHCWALVLGNCFD